MILSFDVPDIVRLPIGTCWPLTGAVILRLCAIGDCGDNNFDACGAGNSLFAVAPVTFDEEDGDEEGGDIGNWLNCPYALLIHVAAALISKIQRDIP